MIQVLPVSHVNQRLLRLSRLCPVVSPVICQSKGHLCGGHLLNRCREPVMLMNKSKLNGLLNADTVIVQKKPATAVNQPVSGPAKSVSELLVSPGKDFSSLVKEGFTTCHIVSAHASGFPVFIIFCHVAILIMVVINAGRQLFFCIHKNSPLKQSVMSMRMLPVPSDRGRQTHRSENVQAVMGILCPATVRPAPFFLFSHSQVSGYLRGSDAPGGQRDMEVKVCLPQ